MKPVVGVLPLWDESKDSIWMLPGYLDGLLFAGAVPVILPFSADESVLDRITDVCDGFLFTGGHDVSPALYGEKPLCGINDVCEKRDALELAVFRRAAAADKPVLGICRGLQFINAAMGGTLYQDLPSQRPSDISHRQQPPYDIPSHTVKVEKDTPLYKYLQTDNLDVNSSHHQAVKNLAPGLLPMAFSPDGIVEAFFGSEQRFLWAVQWHPERLFRKDEYNGMIFKAFVEAMQDQH